MPATNMLFCDVISPIRMLHNMCGYIFSMCNQTWFTNIDWTALNIAIMVQPMWIMWHKTSNPQIHETAYIMLKHAIHLITQRCSMCMRVVSNHIAFAQTHLIEIMVMHQHVRWISSCSFPPNTHLKLDVIVVRTMHNIYYYVMCSEHPNVKMGRRMM